MTILDFLFPKKCVGCGKWGSYVCDTCFNLLKWLELQICPMCGRASVGGVTHFRCKQKWGMDGLVSLVEYEGVGKKVITIFKFKFVADLIEEAVGKILDRDMVWLEIFRGFTVVPVPLHPRREKWRGFNQAREIGKLVASRWSLAISDLLIKTRNTGQQLGKTRKERLEAVKESFQLKTRHGGGQARDQLPKAILVVDDVWTSGATMRECAKVLKRAGVERVWGLTLARRVWVGGWYNKM